MTSNRIDLIPMGMVLAPHTWGRFADALLVGNEDGGQINAFDRDE